MALYKSTEDGQIPMTAEEEAQIRAEWAAAEDEAKKPKKKNNEERLADIEDRLKKLEKADKNK